MSRALIAGLLTTAVLAAAPAPKDDDIARVWRAYGTVHDPDKGTEFKPGRGALHVIVPRERRLLGARNGFNAPRAWRDVRGDFTATVRASFAVRPEVPAKHIQGEESRAGGGLVVWADEKNFLTVTRDEQDFNHKPGEWFRGESRVADRGRSVSERVESRHSGYVRVRRNGKEFEGSYSTDGLKWVPLCAAEAAWGDTLKVGVVAENNYKAPFEVVFDEYALIPAKP